MSSEVDRDLGNFIRYRRPSRKPNLGGVTGVSNIESLIINPHPAQDAEQRIRAQKERERRNTDQGSKK